jgi:hypothetical protein
MLLTAMVFRRRSLGSRVRTWRDESPRVGIGSASLDPALGSQSHTHDRPKQGSQCVQQHANGSALGLSDPRNRLWPVMSVVIEQSLRFGATLAHLAERAGDEDGVAHFVRFRTRAPAASRSRLGTRNVNTGLKMSSRSRVNFELLMYQRPSIFS